MRFGSIFEHRYGNLIKFHIGKVLKGKNSFYFFWIFLKNENDFFEIFFGVKIFLFQKMFQNLNLRQSLVEV
jgi:hypothetical protein